MPKKQILGAACAACALGAAGTAGAAGAASGIDTALSDELTAATGPAKQARRAAHKQLMRRHERAARAHARLRDVSVEPDLRAELQQLSSTGLQARTIRLSRKVRRLRHRVQPVAVSPALQAIAACESGGDPHAIGGGGAFRGKYQFTMSTWAAMGGTGDPAAASEAEQDRRAAMLYATAGAGQWPVCGA